MSLRMGIDVWPRCAHATQCLGGMGGAMEWAGGWPACWSAWCTCCAPGRRSAAYDAWGYGLRESHVRGAERGGLSPSSRALAGPRWRAVPCRGYADYCSSPLLITLTVRVRYVHVLSYMSMSCELRCQVSVRVSLSALYTCRGHDRRVYRTSAYGHGVRAGDGS